MKKAINENKDAKWRIVVLKLFIQNAGIVLRRDIIMERVWGIEYEGESRTLDMHIKTLRQKLGENGVHIKTVRNVGYMME